MNRGRLLRQLVRACLAALAVVAFGLGALIWDGLHDEIEPADIGVVLGNTVHPDGTPSRRLAARLDRTAELFKEGIFPLILVSGATGKEGHDEALVMRDYLIERGVPAAQVLVDSEGRTTFATAANTRRVMDERRLSSALVISQYFHVPRARLALRRSGIARVYSAHARFFELRDIYSVPRELVGLLSYAMKSYDEPPPPAAPPSGENS